MFKNQKVIIMKSNNTFHRYLAIALVLLFSVITVGPAFSSVAYGVDLQPAKMEVKGDKDVKYLVKDIDALKKPYSYTIGKDYYMALEVIAILACLGAIGFGVVHGGGRYIANKLNPVKLELVGSDYIYSMAIRIGHWLNAIAVVALFITGFAMHWGGPKHALGEIHNMFGLMMVFTYGTFVIHEIVTMDIKQFIGNDWELKVGIGRQALYYGMGIFQRKENPSHMTRGNRLNPMQKLAYFKIMFLLAPLVVVSGFLLMRPDICAPIIAYFGLENMKVIFITHLIGAFGMLAFVLGHVYLATTGDTVGQHFEVMITGYHKVYKKIKPTPALKDAEE